MRSVVLPETILGHKIAEGVHAIAERVHKQDSARRFLIHPFELAEAEMGRSLPERVWAVTRIGVPLYYAIWIRQELTGTQFNAALGEEICHNLQALSGMPAVVGTGGSTTFLTNHDVEIADKINGLVFDMSAHAEMRNSIDIRPLQVKIAKEMERSLLEIRRYPRQALNHPTVLAYLFLDLFIPPLWDLGILGAKDHQAAWFRIRRKLVQLLQPDAARLWEDAEGWLRNTELSTPAECGQALDLLWKNAMMTSSPTIGAFASVEAEPVVLSLREECPRFRMNFSNSRL